MVSPPSASHERTGATQRTVGSSHHFPEEALTAVKRERLSERTLFLCRIVIVTSSGLERQAVQRNLEKRYR